MMRSQRRAFSEITEADEPCATAPLSIDAKIDKLAQAHVYHVQVEQERHETAMQVQAGLADTLQEILSVLRG